MDVLEHTSSNPTQSDVHRTESRKLFSRKNNVLTNHDRNKKIKI